MILHFLFICHCVDECFLKILQVKYIIKVEIERKYSEIKQQVCKWIKNIKCLVKHYLQNYLKQLKHLKIQYEEMVIFLFMGLETFVLFFPYRQDPSRYSALALNSQCSCLSLPRAGGTPIPS